MDFLLFPAVAFGAIAFVFGALLASALLLRSIWHAIRGRWAMAVKFMILCLLSLGILAICYALFASQPVQWPWAPAHIPAYLFANIVFFIILQVQRSWEKAEA